MLESIISEFSALTLVVVNGSSEAVVVEVILDLLAGDVRGHVEAKGVGELVKDFVLEVHAIGLGQDLGGLGAVHVLVQKVKDFDISAVHLVAGGRETQVVGLLSEGLKNALLGLVSAHDGSDFLVGPSKVSPLHDDRLGSEILDGNELLLKGFVGYVKGVGVFHPVSTEGVSQTTSDALVGDNIIWGTIVGP
jgi:hypothetical protein